LSRRLEPIPGMMYSRRKISQLVAGFGAKDGRTTSVNQPPNTGPELAPKTRLALAEPPDEVPGTSLSPETGIPEAQIGHQPDRRRDGRQVNPQHGAYLEAMSCLSTSSAVGRMDLAPSANTTIRRMYTNATISRLFISRLVYLMNDFHMTPACYRSVSTLRPRPEVSYS
jgi:hypothetical protein